MDELRELYQATILDHNKSPRNFRAPEGSNCQADGHNPLCGDKITVYLEVDDEGCVVDAGFEGSGCAISTASASLMTEFVKGKPRKEIDETFERFHDLCAGSSSEKPEIPELGKLAVFAGVREYPMRVKCATLAWHTLEAALDGKGTTAKTE
ncbi:MAG: SUF system NifU family Fe-S cluster assembly protein [Deltaproteobacteria bacterium]|nr:SUF system NifU family Fe-S cluster assembly protein [Deltaproteobacteria bacterium]